MAISPPCSISRAIVAATSLKGPTHDRRRPDRPRQASDRGRHTRLLPRGDGEPAGTGRRPGAGAPALPVARSLHAAAHDRDALLYAAVQPRPAVDRRLGWRG